MLQLTSQVAPTASKPRLWQSHVDGWQKSGLSQREYCQTRGLSLSTFTLWRRRLVATESPIEIVPVAVHRPSRASTQAIVLTVNGRYRLEVSDDFQPGTLSGILDVLETR